MIVYVSHSCILRMAGDWGRRITSRCGGWVHLSIWVIKWIKSGLSPITQKMCILWLMIWRCFVLHDELVSPDNLCVAEEWYGKQNSWMQDFIEKSQVWIMCAKRKIEEELDRDGDSIKSTQSKSSQLIASGRAKERAQTAELKATMVMLDRKNHWSVKQKGFDWKKRWQLHKQESVHTPKWIQKALCFMRLVQGVLLTLPSFVGFSTTSTSRYKSILTGGANQTK